MAVKTEIERKFRLADPGIVAGLGGRRLLQGYFGRLGDFHLRLRVAGEGEKAEAWATLKSDAPGIARRELETAIPPALALRLLKSWPERHQIEKTRYRMRAVAQGLPALTWEIDHFHGRHDGLWLAEIELDRPERALDLPPWIGTEVTDDPAYRNAALADAPAGPIPEDAELQGYIDSLGKFV